MSVPWNEEHDSGCENGEYYRCQKCSHSELVHESELNRCEICLLFIPRVLDCVCNQLRYEVATQPSS